MPVEPWDSVALTVGLAAARTVPVTWLVPALGGPRVAPGVRVGLGVLLAVLCLPVLTPAVQTLTAAGGGGAVRWIIVAARELMVGATVGLAAGAVFRAAEAAGRLVDLGRGASAAGLMGPEGGGGRGATADLYLFVSTILFLELGGLRLMASALARSYEGIPLGGPAGGAALRSAVEVVLLATGRLLESAVVFAAPVLVAMVLADVTLALVVRLVPQVPLAAVALPAKALLGLGIVLVGLGALEAAWVAGFPSWMALVERAFASWR